MGETVVDGRGRVTLPRKVRGSLGLEPGKRVVVESRGGEVVLRPAVSREDVMRELKGCITRKNKVGGRTDPLKVKEIWKRFS
ncbi:MAG: AbrB/MazE/SpoVT family DNA-binding domain-containing protein [Euryarchaeota archaeon]|nr:AbrB/MazE/SpoVT family DNA-binding domain-containing protein [Euryarchaeota archaeon]